MCKHVLLDINMDLEKFEQQSIISPPNQLLFNIFGISQEISI